MTGYGEIIFSFSLSNKKNRCEVTLRSHPISVYPKRGDAYYDSPMRYGKILLPVLLLALVYAFLPSNLPGAQGRTDEVLAGGTKGLYRITSKESEISTSLIWDAGSVDAIIPSPEGWYLLGSKGVVFSRDLHSFETRSAGLPTKTLKIFKDGAFELAREQIEIKSLAFDPASPNRLAVNTATQVWYSEDSGRSWKSLGSPSTTQGVKAVAFGPWQGATRHVVWASHAIKGLFTKDVNAKDTNAANGWIPATMGLPRITGSNSEEVSGFALLPGGGGSPSSPRWNFIAGLSFLGRILLWNPVRNAFTEAWSDGGDFGTVDALLSVGNGSAYAISGGSIQRLQLGLEEGRITMSPDRELTDTARSVIGAIKSRHGDSVGCAAWLSYEGAAEAAATVPSSPVAMNELWRLGSGAASGAEAEDAATRRIRMADGKNGLYLQTGFAIDPTTRARYFDLIEAQGLNSLVVDMKDDYGRLRFKPSSPLLSSMGRTGQTLDIEAFSKEAKARGIYLIARIVVFKDDALYSWNGGVLALRDAGSGKAWQGLRSDGQAIQEFWVDPYSTQVWRYNVEIAKEVASLGFDEIQFDYIRFPTDGENLSTALYTHQEAGMTQDSALESFLRFARQSLDLPIGIDIYGANGWYRSGTRTGQDVEMLADYVDVICPMLYPSHFEQGFLAQDPAELRPYRIYRIGSLRNSAIARGKVLIRPYVQAFYLDVSYDRVYYNIAYVAEEVRGIREGANQGMTFWNNSGRYADIPSLR